jgi:transcription initiation factor IIF auxiliary subunit
MDQVREVRASQFLVPKTQLLEYRREEARVEFKSIEMRDGMDSSEKAEPLTRLQDKDLVAVEKLENVVTAAAIPVAAIAGKVTDAA